MSDRRKILLREINTNVVESMKELFDDFISGKIDEFEMSVQYDWLKAHAKPIDIVVLTEYFKQLGHALNHVS